MSPVPTRPAHQAPPQSRRRESLPWRSFANVKACENPSCLKTSVAADEEDKVKIEEVISSDPEQAGMTTRQQVNWFKAMPAKKNPDGVQKVRLFVRLVDDESRFNFNASLVGKDTARPYYLPEGVYTPPNAPSGGAMRLMAGFRDYLIQTGAEAVVEEINITSRLRISF